MFIVALALSAQAQDVIVLDGKNGNSGTGILETVVRPDEASSDAVLCKVTHQPRSEAVLGQSRDLRQWRSSWLEGRSRDKDEARRCLIAAERSGLGRADWARENGIDGRSLNARRLNLERSTRAGKVAPLRLVELVPAAVSVQPTTYRIQCGEFVVEVDDRFDDKVLRRVLAVVAEC